MNKIHLYKIKSNQTIGDLYKSFKEFDSLSSNFSFIIDTFTKDILEIKSFEKIKSKIKITSPIGELSFLEYETYQTLVFSIFKISDQIYLALHNPPRSVRSFFNLLSLISGPGYSIEEFHLNLLEISDYLTSQYNCVIKFVEIEKISLNHQSYANVEVFSSNNALQDFNEFIEKNNLNLNKITIKINNLFNENSFSLNKKGVIHVNNYNLENSLSGNDVYKYILEIITLKS